MRGYLRQIAKVGGSVVLFSMLLGVACLACYVVVAAITDPGRLAEGLVGLWLKCTAWGFAAAAVYMFMLLLHEARQRKNKPAAAVLTFNPGESSADHS